MEGKFSKCFEIEFFISGADRVSNEFSKYSEDEASMFWYFLNTLEYNSRTVLNIQFWGVDILYMFLVIARVDNCLNKAAEKRSLLRVFTDM